jgi:hypothetical protein
VRHDVAWQRLPDLLDDRDDPALLAHVGSCADCQRQLFLLARVDRLLRSKAAQESVGRSQRQRLRQAVTSAAAVAVAAGALVAALLVWRGGPTNQLTFRTSSGRAVATALMVNSDTRNVSLALTARHLPIGGGHMFVLWAADNKSPMQVGHFMVDRFGGCRVRFNLPATHDWHRFWISRPGITDVVASA